MSPSKKIYGLIGYPVKHSLSPLMHNAAFKHLGINAEYRLFEVKPEELEKFLLNRKEVSGFNITVPHKVRAKEILEKDCSEKHPVKDSDEHPAKDSDEHPAKDSGEHSPIEDSKKHPAEISAEIVGAINTVNREPELKFYNTDSIGFSAALEKDLGFGKEGKTVLLIGCGGAGRAVIGSLTAPDSSVKKIYIYEVNNETAESALRYFSQCKYTRSKCEFIGGDRIPEIIGQCQLLVNASPVGMKETDASSLDKSLLHKNLYVYDVVYNRVTDLIKDARSLGLAAESGAGMLLYQGASAFEIWIGEEAPVEIMKEALKEGLK